MRAVRTTLVRAGFVLAPRLRPIAASDWRASSPGVSLLELPRRPGREARTRRVETLNIMGWVQEGKKKAPRVCAHYSSVNIPFILQIVIHSELN